MFHEPSYCLSHGLKVEPIIALLVIVPKLLLPSLVLNSFTTNLDVCGHFISKVKLAPARGESRPSGAHRRESGPITRVGKNRDGIAFVVGMIFAVAKLRRFVVALAAAAVGQQRNGTLGPHDRH